MNLYINANKELVATPFEGAVAVRYSKIVAMAEAGVLIQNSQLSNFLRIYKARKNAKSKRRTKILLLNKAWMNEQRSLPKTMRSPIVGNRTI